MDRRTDGEREVPEVEFTFRGNPPTEEELQAMIAKRDALLKEMGYLPPDANHNQWWKPE